VAAGPNDALYLLYDYGGRTQDFSSSPVGTFVASVKFPFHIGAQAARPISFIFLTGATAGSFTVGADLDGDGVPDLDAASLGIEAGLGFHSSPHISGPHEIVELEVPLLIQPGFGPGFPSGGLQGDGKGDGYSPEPAFWGAAAQKNDGDPPISSAIFQIDPNGSTLITPFSTILLPEPASLGLLAMGGLLMARRRR
jgi:hypothetical protein